MPPIRQTLLLLLLLMGMSAVTGCEIAANPGDGGRPPPPGPGPTAQAVASRMSLDVDCRASSFSNVAGLSFEFGLRDATPGFPIFEILSSSARSLTRSAGQETSHRTEITMDVPSSSGGHVLVELAVFEQISGPMVIHLDEVREFAYNPVAACWWDVDLYGLSSNAPCIVSPGVALDVLTLTRVLMIPDSSAGCEVDLSWSLFAV